MVLFSQNWISLPPLVVTVAEDDKLIYLSVRRYRFLNPHLLIHLFSLPLLNNFRTKIKFPRKDSRIAVIVLPRAPIDVHSAVIQELKGLIFISL